MSTGHFFNISFERQRIFGLSTSQVGIFLNKYRGLLDSYTTIMKNLLTVFYMALIAMNGCASEQKVDSNSQPVKLFEGLGNHRFPITAKHPLAQRYFNQGLILAYAFNHRESERSFRWAIQIDPRCAMCYWGIAFVLGPNINAVMDDHSIPNAFQAVQRALVLSKKVTGKEQALIKALGQRYAATPIKDRSKLDTAYADAMRDVVRAYPNDADVGTLLADALMNQHPWDYWTGDGRAKPWAPEIVATLESVLEYAPLHPGANHLYIHAVEASNTPERALPSADRLRDLVPGAGHLVHMPAHIYIRTGHYQKAIAANQKAVEVDHDYMEHHHIEGIYPLAYIPHNHHFLWAAASKAGRGADAIAAAESTASHVDTVAMRQSGMATLEHYYATPLFALVRFAKWKELLNRPLPENDLRYLNAIWHYARGQAFVARGNLGKAQSELKELEKISKEPAIAKISIWSMNTIGRILEIAQHVLRGKIAASKGNTAQAITLLREAVRLEDSLRYNEPSDWYHPVRQPLGAVLLKAGKSKQAEQIYRQDLKRNPENGWSLFGLMTSLRAQNKMDEADNVELRYKKAWVHADFDLSEIDLMN